MLAATFFTLLRTTRLIQYCGFSVTFRASVHRYRSLFNYHPTVGIRREGAEKESDKLCLM